MRLRRAAVLALGAGAVLTCPVASGLEQEGAVVDDQIVVLGEALEELRVRVELAENDVYARFNEINSTDLYDMHCYERPKVGSRILHRICLSNGWREADAAFAEALLRGMQGPAATPEGAGGSGGYGSNPGQFRANQLRGERLVVEEMRDLARKDPELRDAMMRLGQAYQALEAVTGLRPEWTLYREVAGGEEGLPFAAERMFDVRIGNAPWSHSLTARTFTISGVDGRIRHVRVHCDEADSKLHYEQDVDWTIPESWGGCTLYVHARRDTTFALLEFE